MADGPSLLDDLMRRGPIGGGGKGAGPKHEADLAEVVTSIGEKLAGTGVKMFLPIDISSLPEDGAGAGLSLKNGAPLKADSTVPSIINSLTPQGGILWKQIAEAFVKGAKDGIKSQADGVDGSNATHTNEAASRGDAPIEPNHGLGGVGAGHSSGGHSHEH